MSFTGQPKRSVRQLPQRQCRSAVTLTDHQMTAERTILLHPTWGSYDDFTKLLSQKHLSPTISRESYNRLYTMPIRTIKNMLRRGTSMASVSANPKTVSVAVQTEPDRSSYYHLSSPVDVADWSLEDSGMGSDKSPSPVEEKTEIAKRKPPSPAPEQGNAKGECPALPTSSSTPASVEKSVEESTANTTGTGKISEKIEESIKVITGRRELEHISSPTNISDRGFAAANHLWTKTRGKIIDDKYYTYCASIINEYLDSAKIKDPWQRRKIMDEAIYWHTSLIKFNRNNNPFVSSSKIISRINHSNLTNCGVRKKKFLFFFTSTKKIKGKPELLKDAGVSKSK
uniref:Uncharacterized protein n=1 Tax=Hymenopteran tombus-related virus TaxID=2822555 RepID=A0A8A6RH08_9TOMB|nr:hypothetical protein [Hymenopteran tombus-related virus]